MVAVDPENDDIERFVVLRYAYDPERRERRHRVVAAFDNVHECEVLIAALDSELQHRRGSAADLDPRERIGGAVLEAGYRRRQRDGRLLARAMDHGVPITEQFLAGLDLPASVGVVRFGS